MPTLTLTEARAAEKQHKAWMVKTKSFWHNQKKRADKSGQNMLFALEELRLWLSCQGPAWLWRCYYCGAALKLEALCLDHVLPIARGGLFSLENLAPACDRCNSIKGALTGEEFAELLTLVNGWPEVARGSLFKRLLSSGSLRR